MIPAQIQTSSRSRRKTTESGHMNANGRARTPLRAAAQEIHLIQVFADGGDRKRTPRRAAPVQVESKCSRSHGPVGRRLVRKVARRSTSRRPVAKTPLMILVKFVLPLSGETLQDAYASSAVGVSPRSSTWPSSRRVNRDAGSRRTSEA